MQQSFWQNLLFGFIGDARVILVEEMKVPRILKILKRWRGFTKVEKKMKKNRLSCSQQTAGAGRRELVLRPLCERLRNTSDYCMTRGGLANESPETAPRRWCQRNRQRKDRGVDKESPLPVVGSRGPLRPRWKLVRGPHGALPPKEMCWARPDGARRVWMSTTGCQPLVESTPITRGKTRWIWHPINEDWGCSHSPMIGLKVVLDRGGIHEWRRNGIL